MKDIKYLMLHCKWYIMNYRQHTSALHFQKILVDNYSSRLSVLKHFYCSEDLYNMIDNPYLS